MTVLLAQPTLTRVTDRLWPLYDSGVMRWPAMSVLNCTHLQMNTHERVIGKWWRVELYSRFESVGLCCESLVKDDESSRVLFAIWLCRFVMRIIGKWQVESSSIRDLSLKVCEANHWTTQVGTKLRVRILGTLGVEFSKNCPKINSAQWWNVATSHHKPRLGATLGINYRWE
jgi:hypothetical protein